MGDRENNNIPIGWGSAGGMITPPNWRTTYKNINVKRNEI